MFDPLRGELFTAERGAGAQLDGRRLRVSQRLGLDGALIGTGFPFRENKRWLKAYLAMLERVMRRTAGVRRPGAASLDLAYVAAGRLDGFWEVGLSPWDTAAGNLLITEAGGMIGNLAGGEYRDGGNLLVGFAARLRRARRIFRAVPRRRASQIGGGARLAITAGLG